MSDYSDGIINDALDAAEEDVAVRFLKKQIAERNGRIESRDRELVRIKKSLVGYMKYLQESDTEPLASLRIFLKYNGVSLKSLEVEK